jgi:hypothetical protein
MTLFDAPPQAATEVEQQAVAPASASQTEPVKSTGEESATTSDEFAKTPAASSPSSPSSFALSYAD